MSKVAPTKASDVIEQVDDFTPEQLAAIEQYTKDMAKLLEQYGPKAKYKIECRLSEERSTWKPMFGMVYLWFSGSKHHGGGDSKAYWCPRCSHIIPAEAHDIVRSVCPNCGWAGTGAKLIGEYFYRLPQQHWATVLLHHFHTCEQNADILLRYSLDNLHRVQASTRERASNADRLTVLRMRRLKNGSIYPMANIIRDVSNGADLYGRFRAFLNA